MESTREPVSRYRLYVAASNVIDLIAGAGGWLADHAMAGWDVTGFIADSHGDREGRPLQILGAGGIKFQTALDFREPNAHHMLVIAPDLYERDVRLRAQVTRAIKLGQPEVIFLGGGYPPKVRGTPTKAEHQCSLAALAFKTKALAAVGSSARNIAAREFFFSWPTMLLPPTDEVSRLRDNGAGRRLPRAVSVAL
jgi:hypothetical protein